MQKWSTNRIRETFLQYFHERGHEIVPSSPLLPHNDPTLMFTNAGMNQFKNVFTGLEKRPYDTAASSQKCVRAGGKHNDLENVGYTARHHTFFEMLGNFAFGSYFKAEAIEYAWTLLTQVFEIDPERLYVTVYHTDDEAFELWQQIAKIPSEKIIRISTNDNFWSMGDVGPCGPCSEIFYDHGAQHYGGPPGSPEEDGDRFVEIWNLVFMQYDQVGPDQRHPLPRPCIDTGAGLERIAAVLQGVHSNYEIDTFVRLIDASKHHSGATDPAHEVSHRVIADHLRSSSFLIADGVLPSNEGRGYVLRRIMRRAMRHAYLLGTPQPLMHKLVPTLLDEMGGAYPELIRASALIEQTLELEEERFRQTLGRGLKLLDEELENLPKEAAFSGETAFRLYDTFGFPLDLTQDILRGQGRSVDLDAFEAAMAKQKAEARKNWVGSGEKKDAAIWFDLYQSHGATEFLGYDCTEAEGQIQSLLVDGKPVSEVTGSTCQMILNQTPFYAESGGQIFDTGWVSKGQTQGTVTNCQKVAEGLFVHTITDLKGPLKTGDTVHLTVDAERRQQVRANHSATHLLHAVLRQVLGDHVTQKGSLVTPDRLRFDFAHPLALCPGDLQVIEAQVNQLILENTPASTQIMTPQEAVKVGAMALFGEKYGDEVRVVSMGSLNPKSEQSFSVELCGGTHVNRTGDIGLFKILQESGVSAGVRRIEAVTGIGALSHIAKLQTTLQQACALVKGTPETLQQKLETLLEDRKALERDIKKLKEQSLSGAAQQSTAVKTVAGVSYLAQTRSDLAPKDLKPAVDHLKQQLKSAIVVLGTDAEGKASLVVGVTDDLTNRFSAVDLVKMGAATLGGSGGGGRPDMAQAGGPDAQALSQAYACIEAHLAKVG